MLGDLKKLNSGSPSPLSTPLIYSPLVIVSLALGVLDASGATTHTGGFAALGGPQSSPSYSGAGYHGTGHGHGTHSSDSYSGAGGGETSSLSQALGFNVFQTEPSVVGRFLFYNDSKFDNNNADATTDDDDAIAPAKSALTRGNKAAFENISSYHHGINGLFVDIQNPAGDLTINDFSFRVGNNDSPAGWEDAASPSQFVIRTGEGTAGSTRVAITWGNGTIAKTWLEVTVKATEATGLEIEDIFYFGNAIGKTPGDSDAAVDAQDELQIRNNPRGFFNPAPVDFGYDLDRDGFVNATDQLISRSNVTGFFDQLLLITPTVE